MPSRRLITERAFQALSADQQAAAIQVWSEPAAIDLQATLYRALPAREKAEVVDTQFSHLLYLQETQHEIDTGDVGRQLLHERLTLPVADGVREHVHGATPIHEATPPSYLQAGVIRNSAMGNSLRITYRLLQYGLLDGDDARMPNASLEAGKVTVDIRDGKLRLREAQLFNVTTLHADSTPLPGRSSFAWHAGAGWQRNDLSCDGCLDAQLTFLAGKSMGFGPGILFLLAGPQLASTVHQDGLLAGVAQAGALLHLSSNQRLLLEVEHRNAGQGSGGRRTHLRGGYRYRFSSTLDLRLNGVSQPEESAWEASAGASLYF